MSEQKQETTKSEKEQVVIVANPSPRSVRNDSGDDGHRLVIKDGKENE